MTASAGDRLIMMMRLQPDLDNGLVDEDEPFPPVTASFALVDVVAGEPLAFDQRCLVQFYLVTQRP